MAIRSAHTAHGDPRTRVLVPESAHGTNPATAALCGYKVDPVPGNDRGRIDLASVRAKIGEDVAAIMLTNPNTLGLFEDEVLGVAEAVHSVGGYFYCDGANLNAIVGRVRPGDLGVDAMHINLHKTFSTPHGGGGPGSGPVAFSEALAPFAPLPMVVKDGDLLRLVETKNGEAAQSLGRLRSFHGQMGMFTRALAYMMSHGADGLRQIAEDAVLSANYLLSQLQDDLSVAYSAPCMHEVLFRRQIPGGHRGHHAGFRQGHDRRRLSPHDRLFSLGGPWGDADGTDGIREQGQPRSSDFDPEVFGKQSQGRGCDAFHRGPTAGSAPPGRRNGRRPQSRPALDSARGGRRRRRVNPLPLGVGGGKRS